MKDECKLLAWDSGELISFLLSAMHFVHNTMQIT